MDWEELAQEIMDLSVQYNKPVTVERYVVGPQVVRYYLQPGTRTVSGKPRLTRASLFANRVKDISAQLGVPMSVDTDSKFVIDVPRDTIDIVPLESIMVPAGENDFTLTLGKTPDGEVVSLDLSDPRSPHLLIAGATGSGKSVAIKAAIEESLRKYDDVALYIIDPKQVDLSEYQDVAHGYVNRYKSDMLLREMVQLMRHRYETMSKVNIRSIYEPNDKVDFDRVLVVIDELADICYNSEAMVALQEIAQMGRAAGIHLVVATQRPSADIIDGSIKANFPTRLSFNVATKTDSRVVLDRNGAEQLRGRGDALLLNGNVTRLQGAIAQSKVEHRIPDGATQTVYDLNILDDSPDEKREFEVKPWMAFVFIIVMSIIFMLYMGA